MKKIIASTVVFALFAAYASYLHGMKSIAADTQGVVSPADTGATTGTIDPQPITVASARTSDESENEDNDDDIRTRARASAPTPTPTPVSAQTTPADTPKGLYKDGTYTGSSANAFYGYIQVRVTVSGGKISDIAFLDYPRDRRESEIINNRAMPILKQEAIAAQSARVDGVSGATDTSEAFVQSLGSALSGAKA